MQSQLCNPAAAARIGMLTLVFKWFLEGGEKKRKKERPFAQCQRTKGQCGKIPPFLPLEMPSRRRGRNFRHATNQQQPPLPLAPFHSPPPCEAAMHCQSANAINMKPNPMDGRTDGPLFRLRMEEGPTNLTREGGRQGAIQLRSRHHCTARWRGKISIYHHQPGGEMLCTDFISASSGDSSIE